MLYYNELLDALGLPRATLVGHSFGGMVAAEIAATNPERVDQLVLIAPVGLWRDDHPIPDFSGVPPERLPGLLLADPNGPVGRHAAGARPDRPRGDAHGRHDAWPRSCSSSGRCRTRACTSGCTG